MMRGATVARLGRRLAAAGIDALPVVAVLGLSTLLLSLFPDPLGASIVWIASGLGITAYGLYRWWSYGMRGAGLGARVMGLRLVSMDTGEPIGWWRYVIRMLVLYVALATGVGGVALLIFLALHPRRQGWHDLAVRALVVEPRASEVALREPRTATAGLPAEYAGFDPQQAQGAGAPQEMEAIKVVNPQRAAVSTPVWASFDDDTVEHGDAEGEDEPPAQAPWPASQGATQPGRRSHMAWIPLPTPTSVIEPSPATIRARRAAEEAAESACGRPGYEGWFVRLDDGREVDLNVTVLLGRNPQKSPGDPEVHLVPSSGDGRKISRTHLLIGTDQGGVFVIDRGSTNGTAVVALSGDLEACPPGVAVRVREGQQVSYGNRWFTVLRRVATAAG